MEYYFYVGDINEIPGYIPMFDAIINNGGKLTFWKDPVKKPFLHDQCLFRITADEDLLMLKLKLSGKIFKMSITKEMEAAAWNGFSLRREKYLSRVDYEPIIDTLKRKYS